MIVVLEGFERARDVPLHQRFVRLPRVGAAWIDEGARRVTEPVVQAHEQGEVGRGRFAGHERWIRARTPLRR